VLLLPSEFNGLVRTAGQEVRSKDAAWGWNRRRAVEDTGELPSPELGLLGIALDPSGTVLTFADLRSVPKRVGAERSEFVKQRLADRAGSGLRDKQGVTLGAGHQLRGFSCDRPATRHLRGLPGGSGGFGRVRRSTGSDASRRPLSRRSPPSGSARRGGSGGSDSGFRVRSRGVECRLPAGHWRADLEPARIRANSIDQGPLTAEPLSPTCLGREARAGVASFPRRGGRSGRKPCRIRRSTCDQGG
jgi:hypothetical protein